MPIDYSKYPSNWKTEIRPAILKRAKNRCEQCRVKNYAVILRGIWRGVEAYQDDDGNIFDAGNSVKIGADYLGEVNDYDDSKAIRVVLTIAHLDHDIQNNAEENLRALCQRCHNRHAALYRKQNRKKNKVNKQGLLFLFENPI